MAENVRTSLCTLAKTRTRGQKPRTRDTRIKPCVTDGIPDAARGGPRPTAASGTQQPVQSRAAVGACAPREVPLLRPGARDRRGGAGTWRMAPPPPRRACAVRLRAAASQCASNRSNRINVPVRVPLYGRHRLFSELWRVTHTHTLTQDQEDHRIPCVCRWEVILFQVGCGGHKTDPSQRRISKPPWRVWDPLGDSHRDVRHDTHTRYMIISIHHDHTRWSHTVHTTQNQRITDMQRQRALIALCPSCTV